MKIVQITPSSGESFYCENCLRDLALVRGILALGHSIIMVPLYLPLPVYEDWPAAGAPIFFGGINVYLQEKVGLFRKTPRWVDRVFDCPRLLRWAGRKAGMVSAGELGRTTISMLQGEQGRQRKELDRLVEWLGQEENRPDVVCLSNVLLLGLAKRIKEELGAAIVCLLQDEYGFIEALPRPYSQRAWEILGERSSQVDTFIAVSRFYGELMREKLGVDAERIQVVYVGVAVEEYALDRARPTRPTIGYLARVCPEKGLDVLVDAFSILKEREGLRDARLRITGGYNAADRKFVRRVWRKLACRGLVGDVEYVGQFDSKARMDFFRGISVLSVPEREPAAYGLYVLEALAAGVPVVQPRIGVFPELLEMVGGGVLFEPGDAGALARALEGILLDGEYGEQLGRQGRRGVLEKFDIRQTARAMVRIYEKTLQGSGRK